MGRKKKTAAKEGIKNTLSKNPFTLYRQCFKGVGTFQCLGLSERKFFLSMTHFFTQFYLHGEIRVGKTQN